MFIFTSCLNICLPFLSSYHRDDPKTIKLRFVSSILSCGIAVLLVNFFVRRLPSERLCDVLGICLWNTDWIAHVLLPLAVTSLFFLGPLVVFKDTYTWEELKQVMREEIPDIVFVRNYIVAPITEELIFRSAIFSFLREWNNPWSVVMTASAIFSIAHSHHYFLQKIQGYRSISLTSALIQLGYTFLFGCYSGSFFYKTHNLLSCVSLHIFCNFMGVPDIDTLYSSKNYWYTSLAGIGVWFVVYPYYLMT